MTTTHTPGPWTANIGGAGCNVSVNNTMMQPIVIALNPEWLLTHPNLTSEGQANAKLISAAPELLAACQHALDTFGGVRPDSWAAASRAEFDILSAAIARATEGTQ